MESGISYHSKPKRVAINYCGEGHCGKGKKLITIPFEKRIHPCSEKVADKCEGNVKVYELKKETYIDTCTVCG